jgi:hypothetical protein
MAVGVVGPVVALVVRAELAVLALCLGPVCWGLVVGLDCARNGAAVCLLARRAANGEGDGEG